MCWISLRGTCTVEVTVIDSMDWRDDQVITGAQLRCIIGGFGRLGAPVSLIVTVMVVSFPAFSVELHGPRGEPEKISGERPRMKVLKSRGSIGGEIRLNNQINASEENRIATETSDGIGKKASDWY